MPPWPRRSPQSRNPLIEFSPAQGFLAKDTDAQIPKLRAQANSTKKIAYADHLSIVIAIGHELSDAGPTDSQPFVLRGAMDQAITVRFEDSLIAIFPQSIAREECDSQKDPFQSDFTATRMKPLRWRMSTTALPARSNGNRRQLH